jgi:hypothetical protein
MTIKDGCIVSFLVFELVAIETILARLVRWILQNESPLFKLIPLVLYFSLIFFCRTL